MFLLTDRLLDDASPKHQGAEYQGARHRVNNDWVDDETYSRLMRRILRPKRPLLDAWLPVLWLFSVLACGGGAMECWSLCQNVLTAPQAFWAGALGLIFSAGFIISWRMMDKEVRR